MPGCAVARAGSYFKAQTISFPNTRISQMFSKLSLHGEFLTRSAAESLVGKLQAFSSEEDFPSLLTNIETVIDEGLVNISKGEKPTSAALDAADFLKLSFAVEIEGKNHKWVLALAREAEEIEDVHSGLKIVNADRTIREDNQTRALHAACQAIAALVKTGTELPGFEWSERDPETGLFSAKTALNSLNEPVPTSIVPPINMPTSILILGTGRAKGIVWARPVLSSTIPYELSGIGSYRFNNSRLSGYIPYGELTIEEALVKMGFKDSKRRPLTQIFAPVPAPSKNASELERFTPRGVINIKCLEGGLWAYITIIEDTTQKDVLGTTKGEYVTIMGDEEFINHKLQRTYLKFEYVPTMSDEREKETRNPQRGNIIVLAIPVEEYTIPDFSKLFHSSDPGKGYNPFNGGFDRSFSSNPTRGATLGARSITTGSTHIERDNKTETGQTFGARTSVRINTISGRNPGIIRIVPIGVSVETEKPEFEGTVVSIADFKR